MMQRREVLSAVGAIGAVGVAIALGQWRMWYYCRDSTLSCRSRSCLGFRQPGDRRLGRRVQVDPDRRSADTRRRHGAHCHPRRF